MEFTHDQEVAIDETVKWFKSKSKPYFCISGRAGVGKTTIVPYIIDQLGLNIQDVAICAYTGKAALRLVEQGLQASTIHHLLYKPLFDKQFYALRAKGILTRVKWAKVKELNYKLIIVDEWSMVSQQIFKDLSSYNIPILLLGDSNQLKPVGGQNCEFTPDVEMNQITRQDSDSPIIQLASSILDGAPLVEKEWGNGVRVVSRQNYSQDQIVRDMDTYQLLVQTNATRINFNNRFRRYKQFNCYYPKRGEKLICLQNYWDIVYGINGFDFSLVNGLIGTIDIDDDYLFQIMDEDDFPITDKNFFFEAMFTPNGADNGIQIPICKYPFNKSINTEYLNSDDGNEIPQTCSFDFAYALTVHKFQGSEADNVIVYREWDKTPNWIYTGVTRAKKNLTVVI